MIDTARPTRGPSMADVAAKAGVSSQTVSRVSNGLSNVDPATRERVVAAMSELGYRPNRAARALKSGRFNNIGVIMFTLASVGNMHTLNAISVSAAHAGYSITLITVEQTSQEDVTAAFERLLDQAVDGIVIVIEEYLIDHENVTLPPGLPVVVIDSTKRGDYPVVDTDQAQGAYIATRHLLDLGHETVWHVAGPATSYSALRREESWRHTLEAAGRVVPAAMRGDWTPQSGYAVGLELAVRDDVTAVFAANDQMALGVLRALHEHGRRVPEQISVVGFDDISESDSFWPPLTTVHQDFGGVGSRGVQLLLAEIESGTPLPSMTAVPTRLIVRQSTAPPAAHSHPAG